jgi:hypothetical protein
MTWQTIHQILSQWPEDSDLSGLRDKVSLATLRQGTGILEEP